MSRQDQYAVSVTIDGENTGIWDKMSGGEQDSEETKYKPGAMQREISLGGSTTLGNVTLSRLYVFTRDHIKIKQWMSRAGRAPVIVSKQPLDVDGNAFGDPLVYQGFMKMVTPPDHDSESNDAGLIEIEVSTSGTVA